MPETIFQKIIRGEVPSHKVYEDDHCIAFLDIGPLSRGHTLLVPKEPAATLDTLSDEAAGALGRVLPRLCRAIAETTKCPDYNVLVNVGKPAGQLVEHVHVHIIPKPTDAAPTGDGLEMEWNAGEIDHAKAADLAADIAKAINP